MNAIYTVQISLYTELFNDIEHYFWCIFEQKNGNRYNCGHGWATSIERAASDAYYFYTTSILGHN